MGNWNEARSCWATDRESRCSRPATRLTFLGAFASGSRGPAAGRGVRRRRRQMDTARWKDGDEFAALDLVAKFQFKTASSVSFQLGRKGSRFSYQGSTSRGRWSRRGCSGSSAGSMPTTRARDSTASSSGSGCRIGTRVGSRCGTWCRRSRPRWACLRCFEPTRATIPKPVEFRLFSQQLGLVADGSNGFGSRRKSNGSSIQRCAGRCTKNKSSSVHVLSSAPDLDSGGRPHRPAASSKVYRRRCYE